MVLSSLILFISAFAGGISIYFFPALKQKKFDYLLIFAGAYLLSITIIHILPEVYAQYPNSFQIGIFILIGFLLQMILGIISTGLEHGHIHHIEKNEKYLTPSMLVLGLGAHAFLEGTILSTPVSSGIHNHAGGILIGIVLHKVPAALAFTVIVNAYANKKITTLAYLFIFSICSPMGLWLTSALGAQHMFSMKEMAWLYAIVSGSFLHISTTIFFESNPKHKFRFIKLLVTLAGILLAVLIEFFV